MIKTKEDLKAFLDADHKAFKIRYPFLSRFTYSENGTMFRYIKVLRYFEYYLNKQKKTWDYLIYYWYWLKWRRLNLKYQLHILPNTCAKGLCLVHHGFRRIDSIKHIGENCTILPMVMIGKKFPDSDISSSTIGDNCYLGTGCIIMTPVKIGNNVTIGAGSVVTRDIPDNAIVAGNPAKIIRFK